MLPRAWACALEKGLLHCTVPGEGWRCELQLPSPSPLHPLPGVWGAHHRIPAVVPITGPIHSSHLVQKDFNNAECKQAICLLTLWGERTDFLRARVRAQVVSPGAPCIRICVSACTHLFSGSSALWTVLCSDQWWSDELRGSQGVKVPGQYCHE